MTFAKLDVDANPATARRLRVQSIPRLLFFRDGVKVDQTVGLIPESIIATKIDQLLRAPAPSPRAA